MLAAVRPGQRVPVLPGQPFLLLGPLRLFPVDLLHPGLRQAAVGGDVPERLARLDRQHDRPPQPLLRLLDLRCPGDGPISRGRFEDWYREGLDAAGVRYLSPHKTRHTYGHWLKRTRMFDLEERAMLMRHEDTRTTKKYYPTVSIEDLTERFAELETMNRSQTAETAPAAPLRLLR